MIKFLQADIEKSKNLKKLSINNYDNLIPTMIREAVNLMHNKENSLSDLSKIVSIKIRQERGQLKEWFSSGVINTSRGILKINKLINLSNEVIKIEQKISEELKTLKVKKVSKKFESLEKRKENLLIEIANLIQRISMEISIQ